MRVIFFGTAEFAVPSLTAVAAAGHEIALCVTQPDRPKGRGLRTESSPVKRAAVHLGLPVAQPERPTAALLQPFHPELGIVIAYGRLIPREVLAAATQGMLGVHPSLLPAYRGAAPVARAILQGETTTGVTIFRLTERLDAGAIIRQRSVPIEREEPADRLTERLAHVGAAELVQAIGELAKGQASETPQSDAEATFAPKLTKADGWIDWAQPAHLIVRRIRAVNPWPGAMTQWRGGALKVTAAAARASSASQAAAGTIVEAVPYRMVVATGEGIVDITEVQPANRRRMSVREFLAGHAIRVGDTLG
ncbi:MAG: methionyl-tRNA formyltransferase [Candidatus Omnitrophica bacterium]|nr:methionyl-tRNA formyltransferase [Candidatus Omnitrophota bacterium]